VEATQNAPFWVPERIHIERSVAVHIEAGYARAAARRLTTLCDQLPS